MAAAQQISSSWELEVRGCRTSLAVRPPGLCISTVQREEGTAFRVGHRSRHQGTSLAVAQKKLTTEISAFTVPIFRMTLSPVFWQTEAVPSLTWMDRTDRWARWPRCATMITGPFVWQILKHLNRLICLNKVPHHKLLRSLSVHNRAIGSRNNFVGLNKA